MFIFNKLFLLFGAVFFIFPGLALAHQPEIIYNKTGDITVSSPEISRAFYDELKGESRNYIIFSEKDFILYLNLLVPLGENRKGKYSANVYAGNGEKAQKLAFLDGSNFEWQEYWEEFGRDWYLKGPEISVQLPAGEYKIEVFSVAPADSGNSGKYVLAVGKTESFDINALLNAYWQLPLLKLQFFKSSPLQFFLTPFGIAAIALAGAALVFLALAYFLIGLVSEAIKHAQAKTLLLASGGMAQMKDEIIKLLQKPAYDITVAFITTAAKPEANLDYVWSDWQIMKEELGFNIEEFDIEGKTENQVYEALKLKDIIFVEGGNTFYLLRAMRACKFEKVLRRLLKSGKVYVGVSAGSIVAGRTINTAGWKPNGDQNIVKIKNLKGLNLVPFDIFVHYTPEHNEIIKQKIKSVNKRKKNLRILTDEQAILVQGKEIMLIGEGEQIIV